MIPTLSIPDARRFKIQEPKIQERVKISSGSTTAPFPSLNWDKNLSGSEQVNNFIFAFVQIEVSSTNIVRLFADLPPVKCQRKQTKKNIAQQKATLKYLRAEHSKDTFRFLDTEFGWSVSFA